MRAVDFDAALGKSGLTEPTAWPTGSAPVAPEPADLLEKKELSEQ